MYASLSGRARKGPVSRRGREAKTLGTGIPCEAGNVIGSQQRQNCRTRDWQSQGTGFDFLEQRSAGYRVVLAHSGQSAFGIGGLARRSLVEGTGFQNFRGAKWI